MATITEVSTLQTTLREKQKPLKDQYRSDPSSALVTLSTTGTFDEAAPLTCSLRTGAAAKKIAGLHQAAGGEGFDVSGELCSGDMLLESLVACFGVTIRAVATSMGIPIYGGTLTCSGVLDFRGTLGIKDKDGNPVPVGFKSITTIVRLEVDAGHRSSLQKLIEVSERYCVVLQTIKGDNCRIETRQGVVGNPLPDVAPDTELHLSPATRMIPLI